MMDFFRKKQSVFGALFIVIIDYFICILTSPMVYHTNDDFIIDYALSKAQLGEVWWIPTFIDPKLGFIIGGLYVLKNISWWFYFQHLLIAISLFFINYTILDILASKKIPPQLSMSVILLLNICLFWRWISYIAFTTTPVICIAGVISIIASQAMLESDKKKSDLLIIPLFVLYFIALMIRHDSALAGLPFILLSFFIKYTKNSVVNIKIVGKFCLISFIFVCASLLNIQSRNHLLEQIHGIDYMEFNDARIRYTDYYHDSFNKNPDLYTTIGWDEEMVNLLWNFCMEEKGTVELVYAKNNSETLSRRARVIKSLQDIARDKNSCILLFNAICISFLGALSIAFYKKYKNILYYILNNGGALLLLSYLLIQGRVNLRSINVIILPLCIINIFLCIDSIERHKKKYSEFLFIITIVLLVLGAFLSEGRLFHASAIYASDEREHLYWTKYINEHPENVYIEETGYGAAHTTPRGRISVNNDNYSNTGDADWNCAARKQFCIDNSFENGFLPYIFEEENVYYVTKMDYESIPPYLLYMMKHHQAIGLAVVDRLDAIDNLCIMHFVYDTNKTKYNEYYTVKDNELVFVSIQ